MSDCLNYALRCAASGVPVFAVEGKKPITPNGFHDATTDTQIITGWWQRKPDANIAIPTGAITGVVIIDIDPAEDGFPLGSESLRVLEEEHARFPEGLTVKTPRGGEHIYLRHPGGKVPNSAGKLGPGIDVRGDGGYVLVPPSIGSNGKPYEFDRPGKPAQMPDWLLRLVKGTAPGEMRPATPASEWVAMIQNGLPAGQRNNGLARLVGHWLHKDIHVLEVLALAQHFNETRNRPPLDTAEVEKIVDSLAGRELRKRTAVTR